MHYGGISKVEPNAGLGDDFTRKTGLDARNPSTWRQQIDFALDRVVSHGWGDWKGAAAEGNTGKMGVGKKTQMKGVSLNSTPIGNVTPGSGTYTKAVNAQAGEADPGVYGNPAALTVANTGAYPPAPATAATGATAAPATLGDKIRGVLGSSDTSDLAKAVGPRSGEADQLLPSSLGASMSADAGRAQAAAALMSTIIANRKKYGTTLNTPNMPSLAGFMG